MTILASGGIALAGYAAQTAAAIARARAVEAETRRASAFFDAVSLWPREDLDRHLGNHREGRWFLDIERPQPTLYSVTLTDTNRAVVLRTWLFRRAPSELPLTQ